MASAPRQCARTEHQGRSRHGLLAECETAAPGSRLKLCPRGDLDYNYMITARLVLASR